VNADSGQGQLFYSFCLDDAVPHDHRVRDGVLNLSWVHAELAPHYSHLGRPSIDPVLMIRMIIVGYVFAIRSERLLCLGQELEELVDRYGDPSDGPTADLLSWLDLQAKRNLVLTFGGGVNEIQRELIATAGLGLPRVPR